MLGMESRWLCPVLMVGNELLFKVHAQELGICISIRHNGAVVESFFPGRQYGGGGGGSCFRVFPVGQYKGCCFSFRQTVLLQGAVPRYTEL